MNHAQLDTSFLKLLDPSFYSFQEGKPLLNPYIISVNHSLAHNLQIDQSTLLSEDFLQLINSEIKSHNFQPYASSYSGHQFGYFVPNLGDGRALNLGKLKNYHLQLKGSGTTPYSRDGDGRAVLRSSIREYLMSEAMYGLGIPTTRALALVGSHTKVLRSYTQETAAIVLRASSSWIRFGSFEFAYIQKNKKEYYLKQLADFVIMQSYPELQNKPNRYEELYFAIVDKTLEMIALWQSVGFCHGVMNTDNMSIEGLTIDYGPYAMMEEFNTGFVCNLSDHEGRYSFENQPYIAQWNLSILAKILSPIADHGLMESYNDNFIGKFKKQYFSLMAEKLGLKNYSFDKDKNLIAKLLKTLQQQSVDYTSFFYHLSADTLDLKDQKITSWLKEYSRRLKEETVSKEDRLTQMRKINPKYILRNSMLQEAIDAAQNGDFTLVNDFLKIAHNPYDEWKEYEHYTQPKSGLEAMRCSCSS